MCIGFPGKIISIDDKRRAVIDISGARSTVRMDFMDDLTGIGDYVICHAGFAIHKIDEQKAMEMLDCLKEVAGYETH
jgi:hydrogenase expression/formation protein HypC